ncbi:MAG: MFS transporter [Anaerolineae bacterium]|nr:MFS transporter [Anaerolineae bacterium]
MFKGLDRRLAIILLIVFVQLLGASMILPILPIYARRAFSISDNVVTLLISSFFLAQFIAGPFLGRLSDLYGRLPLLIISQIGTVIAFVMIGAAQSVEVLFLARILDGITGGNIIVAQAYITDITPPKQRTQALGYILAAFGLGFVFGPSLGGIFTSALGPRVSFYFAAAAALVTVILTWLMLDETLTPERREVVRAKQSPKFRAGDIISNGMLMLILFITFGAQFSFSMLQSTFSLFGEDVLFKEYSPSESALRIGLMLSMFGVGQLVTQLYILRRVLERWGEYVLVIMGTALRGISMITLVLLPNPYLAIFSVLVFAIGSGIQLPALQGLAANSVQDELRGGVLGVYQSVNSLGIIVGSALAGSLFAIHPEIPYVIGGLTLIVMTLPSLVLRRRGVTAAIEAG